MEEKKLTMKDYVEETPAMIRENVKNHHELTKRLVDEYVAGDYSNIVIVASGSSYNACMCAKPFMEAIMKKDVKIIPPFSFVHYTKEITDSDFVVVCSQSGRSTNSIEALNYLKSKGKKAIGLTGNLDSDFKDICDVLVEWGVGIEKVGYVTKGVAALAVYLMLFTLNLQVKLNKVTEEEKESYLNEMIKTAEAHEQLQLETTKYIENNKKTLLAMNDVFVLGANANYGTALEAALKIGETVKIHATGYEYEEFLHGPSFPLTPNHTVIMYNPNDSTNERANQIYNACKQVTDKVIMIGCGKNDNNDIHTDIQLCELVSPLAFLAVAPLLAQYPYGEMETKMIPLYKEFGSHVSIKTKKRED